MPLRHADDAAAEQTKSGRDLAIQSFADKFLSGPNQDLYQEMIVTLCRMARDDAGRGDVKLLHKAMQELRYGFKIFAPYRATPKISIFGSSRTPEGHPDYIQCTHFARSMREAGWMVITGAGDGIMKAGHGGAGAEASFGVAIRLPFEQKTNDIIAQDAKLVNFRYFFTRKVMFLKESSAIALFPGGFGTQDEGFEALVLVQTGKAQLIPIVMVEHEGGTYWRRWREYVEAELLQNGMISPQDMNLIYITDSVADAAREVTTFYRVYHSSRWVDDEFVMRFNERLGDETVERCNDEYKDILMSGKMEVTPPLPLENGELPDKFRLKLKFDKRSFGRLRLMLNMINRRGHADPAAGQAAPLHVGRRDSAL